MDGFLNSQAILTIARSNRADPYSTLQHRTRRRNREKRESNVGFRTDVYFVTEIGEEEF